MPPVINRDAVRVHDLAQGDIAFARRRLGAAAGCARIGVSLYQVPPGARQMPLHVHGDEEEIFHVLGGAGLAVFGDAACAVAAGDTVVHQAGGRPHTFIAGDAGLELIAFGSGSHTHLTWLPRAKVMWAGPRWIPGDGPHPFQAEADAGPLVAPAPGERPSVVVASQDVAVETDSGRTVRRLGAAAGAVASRLTKVDAEPGAPAIDRHVHDREEELLYVLAGAGVLRLGAEEHALAVGDVVARPPSSGIAHGVTAGPDGIALLVYGTQVPGDAVYLPDARRLRLAGLGVTLEVPEPG